MKNIEEKQLANPEIREGIVGRYKNIRGFRNAQYNAQIFEKKAIRAFVPVQESESEYEHLKPHSLRFNCFFLK